ncbi:biotin--[acetyl-CoA-carboxylase] ligase [Olsenella profusa]|uniref:Biotin--[acetyl-CoA-carboxylase] ligase n=1 Tax=Olsenella profusa TaxID=138595 RepID=A0ABS2F3N4_9ACTN|nr:biotin--[acetyl-CoA-carboxylase] ligase [Olsenella profusa]MBM6775438.1 biotin--[acetyl-CoA-carboxylase] ligase [Olsenella profusa]
MSLPPISLVESVGSTNDAVLALGRSGAPAGFAVAARQQTAGRGRRGHVWASPEGNLYLSVLLRPDVSPTRLPGLAAACGVGAARGLRAVGANEVQLKWPNDLVARGRKLGGILVEVEGGPAVCGIGVNVLDAPRELGAICLAELGVHPAFEGLAEALRDAIVAQVDAWAASAGTHPLDGVLDDYLVLLAWRSKEVRVLSPDGAELAQGTLDGVDSWGRAVVDGVAFASETASIRLA